VRRLSAEQFRDALTSLTGVGYGSPAAEIVPSESEQKKFPCLFPSTGFGMTRKPLTKSGPVTFISAKTFQLSVVPPDATAVVVCDNSFTFFVNAHKLVLATS